MIAWRAIAALVSILLTPALLVIAAGTISGRLSVLWTEIRTPVSILAVMLTAAAAGAFMTAIARLRVRRTRPVTRYRLELAQSDEATHEETAAACEHLVQVLRATLAARVRGGQPWLAIESWHVPSTSVGETGSATLMLLCEPTMLDPAVAALRRAFPNISVRQDSRGAPVPYPGLRFVPVHVLRVRKARDWALPIADPTARPESSNARSIMAAVVRQQQEVGRNGFISCVRWCLQPAAESVDRLAAGRLRRIADRTPTANAAVSADVLEAQRGGGGALCFVELQAAIEPIVREHQAERYADLQAICRLIVSPALSARGVNMLVERQMIFRQGLYRRRWERATPPLLPDQTGSTLMFASELAVLLEFPGLGSEHGLPLARNTVPHLPAPAGLTRARMRDMPVPPSRSDVACSDGCAAGAGGEPPLTDEPDPLLKIGVAAPDVPWSVSQGDRKYGLLIAAGQGSGKSSLLIRYAMGDILAPNTATIVFDMKGSLAQRLLRLTPPDIPKRYFDHQLGAWREATKRVWYLDLAEPAFGLTPLHVEPGWTVAGLPDEFVRIAGLVVQSLLDLFPGQIFQSSEDIIERAVIGTMAIGWFEHHERHRAAGSDPTAHGFSGSFEVLVKMFAPTDRYGGDEQRGRRREPAPNRWHQAAARACQRINGLAHMADQLLYEIPGQVRGNLHGMEQRMAAPANKLGPLVYSHAAVRRFVEHPERLSLQSVIESHDILIVNPRKDVLGDGSQPEILTNFIVHMINAQLNRQISHAQPTRPRVSLVIDEAHTLITETLMRMVSSHREAGLSVACATQYQSQIGATIQDPAKRAYVRDGWSNLFQTKLIGRASDPRDAEYYAGVLRSVYESMTRGDPTSQARIPAGASTIMALADYHFLLRAISAGRADVDAFGPATSTGGSAALPVCTLRAEPMSEVHEIDPRWGEVHMSRMHEVFATPRTATAGDGPREIPVGLRGATRSPAVARAGDDAREVAAEAVGERRGRAAGPASDATAAEWASLRSAGEADGGSAGPAPPRADTVVVGGARIERAPAREQGPRMEGVALFDWALRPPSSPPPAAGLAPLSETLADAVRYAASIEQITVLGPWTTIADGVVAQAAEAERQARARARLEAARAGSEPAVVERRMNAAGREARRALFARFSDEPWQADVGTLAIADVELRALEILARLPLSAPLVLAVLLSEPLKERALRYRLSSLHQLGLVATSAITVAGRAGRRAPAYAVSARGRELLRHRWTEIRGEGDPPRHLRVERKLPEPGRGSMVPHELAVQLVTGALRAYGATAVEAQWLTPEMSGGQFSVELLHPGDDRVRLEDLTTRPGLAVVDERSDAPGIVVPDVSIRLAHPLTTPPRTISLLIEVDRTARGSYNSEKFVAYDHFLAGWCLKTRRYGRELAARPVVVFVAQDPRAALRLLARADEEMTLGVGLPGHARSTYQFHGRTHTVFTCMGWLLGGHAYGLRMAATPPAVRGRDTPLEAEPVALLPEAWWAKQPTSAARRER